MPTLFQHLQSFRAYCRAVPTWDALRLALARPHPGRIRVRLRSLRRTVELRRGTSDLHCFRKIFLDEDYKLPFGITPEVIVDAGANIGMATLYYAAQYPQCRIIAIEPEASNFELLRLNCGTLPRVTLIRAAVWPRPQALSIRNATAEKWAFTVAPGTEPGAAGEPVPAITIPEILAQSGLDRIDLLKLDIEGAELELFSAGADEWLGRVRAVVLELHDRIRPGCGRAFYSAIVGRPFRHEIVGENVFVQFSGPP